MKRIGLIKTLPVVGALLLLWGCEAADPGSPVGNQPPTVRIVVAPKPDAQHDHFVSPSPMFNVQWIGHDVDGEVVGYYVQVDGGAEVFTTKGDSAIAFEASQADTSSPGRTLPTVHTLKVVSVDNEGARSAVAARTFSVTNYIPRITAFAASFRDSSVIGKGVAFSVEWSDSNESGVSFRVSLDGQPITGWVRQNAFQFCKISDPDIAAGLDEDVHPISIDLLPTGLHTIGVEARDLGGAISAMRQRRVVVADTFKPVISSVASLYGSAAYYPDGSVYHRPNTVTTFTINGEASSYFSRVHSYQYRWRRQYLPPGSADSVWTPWSSMSQWGGAEFTMADMAAGVYEFEIKCRDWAGVESDITLNTVAIYTPNLTADRLLIVDESKDGNGRPGSPDDAQIDNFYRMVLQVDTSTWRTPDGWEVAEIDYSLNRVGNASYISARNVHDKKLIVWHTDDKAVFDLGANTRILQEYLDRGGRLIISGWDVLNPFVTVDSVKFSSGFAYRYLRIDGGKRTNDRNFIGAAAAPAYGYPTLELDPAKYPDRWTGLDKCWVLYPRHLTEGISTWKDFSQNPNFEGSPCVVRNFSPVNAWRTVTIGFPLYFIKDDQALTFFTRLMSEINQ